MHYKSNNRTKALLICLIGFHLENLLQVEVGCAIAIIVAIIVAYIMWYDVLGDVSFDIKGVSSRRRRREGM